MEEVVEGYGTLKRLASSPRHVVPGHDPLVLQHYPSAKAGLVRLDATQARLSTGGGPVPDFACVPLGYFERRVAVTDMGDEVSQAVFTPDGKHALVTKNSANKVALLDVDGDKVTIAKHDILTGLFPYNIVVSPNGAIALTADNGDNGTSDGNVDAVSVIDLTAPVHVIDHVTVPDSPEGLAFSPKGDLAVSADALGSNHST